LEVAGANAGSHYIGRRTSGATLTAPVSNAARGITKIDPALRQRLFQTVSRQEESFDRGLIPVSDGEACSGQARFGFQPF
jgi:hypothetical protein